MFRFPLSMGSVKKHILTLFQKEQNTTLSTSAIVDNLYPSLAESSKAILENSYSSHAQKRAIVSQKATYHRKVLYHLNNLVAEGILEVDSIQKKGEKVFRLALLVGDINASSKFDQMRYHMHHIPSTPLEKYEESQVLYKYEPTTWTQRVNAVLLETSLFESAQDLTQTVYDSLAFVNDVIGLNDFETFLQKVGELKATECIEQISYYAKNYHKQICIIFDITNVLREDVMRQFVFGLTKSLSQHIIVIFDVTSKELMLHRNLFADIVFYFSKQNLKLNMKNDDVHQAPYIIGRAGPYTIQPQHWKSYLSQQYKKTKGLVFSQSSVIIDMQTFSQLYATAKEFDSLVEDVCKSLFISVLEQHKRRQFFVMQTTQSTSEQLVFSYSHCTIRFMNYVQSQDSLFSEFSALVSQAKEKIRSFSHTQRLLYESCGMPIHFDIHFSHAYRKFSQHISLHEIHNRFTIQQTADIYAQKTKSFFSSYAKFVQLFEGGLEVRFIREGRIQSQDGIGEIAGILNTYSCPFFCYNFQLEEEKHTQLKEYFTDDT